MLLTVEQPASESEAGLIEAWKRGDLSAFEHIYATNSSRMKSIAFHLLGNRSDAEDAQARHHFKSKAVHDRPATPARTAISAMSRQLSSVL